MNKRCKKLLLIGAVITLWFAIQPGILSAQASGIGSDSYTRIMWTTDNGQISLWKVSPPKAAAGMAKITSTPVSMPHN
jgi:hypothetical protein